MNASLSDKGEKGAEDPLAILDYLSDSPALLGEDRTNKRANDLKGAAGINGSVN